jgi:hypothetical protein
MGNKFGLYHTSAVEKTEFTLNDDDYVDVDFDIEDYVVLGKNFKEIIDVNKEDVNKEIVKEFVNDVINNAVNDIVKKNNVDDVPEKIIADKLVDDIISNVVPSNKKKKKKKHRNN